MNVKPAQDTAIVVYVGEVQPGDIVLGFEDHGRVTSVDRQRDGVLLRWRAAASDRRQMMNHKTKVQVRR
jgi:hypothetical protein